MRDSDLSQPIIMGRTEAAHRQGRWRPIRRCNLADIQLEGAARRCEVRVAEPDPTPARRRAVYSLRTDGGKKSTCQSRWPVGRFRCHGPVPDGQRLKSEFQLLRCFVQDSYRLKQVAANSNCLLGKKKTHDVCTGTRRMLAMRAPSVTGCQWHAGYAALAAAAH